MVTRDPVDRTGSNPVPQCFVVRSRSYWWIDLATETFALEHCMGEAEMVERRLTSNVEGGIQLANLRGRSQRVGAREMEEVDPHTGFAREDASLVDRDTFADRWSRLVIRAQRWKVACETLDEVLDQLCVFTMQAQ